MAAVYGLVEVTLAAILADLSDLQRLLAECEAISFKAVAFISGESWRATMQGNLYVYTFLVGLVRICITRLVFLLGLLAQITE